MQALLPIRLSTPKRLHMLGYWLLAALLAPGLAAKYQIKLFTGAKCPDNAFLRGSALFAADLKTPAVVPIRDRYDDDAGYTAEVEILHNGEAWLSWHIFNKTRPTQNTELARGSECVVGPRQTTAQSIELSDPAFAVPSCSSDADCEDEINCTVTRCDMALQYCSVKPQHDDCVDVCVPKTCFGGRRANAFCANNGDCVGGICSTARCVGGLYNGQPCWAGRYDAAGKSFGQWENYICEQKGGKCIAGEPDTHCFKNIK